MPDSMVEPTRKPTSLRMEFKNKASLHRASTLAALLLIARMAFLAGGAARRESAAFDEVAHIGAGISYLQKFDLRFNEEPPPLVKMLAAAPLVLRGIKADCTLWTGFWAFTIVCLLSHLTISIRAQPGRALVRHANGKATPAQGCAGEL